MLEHGHSCQPRFGIRPLVVTQCFTTQAFFVHHFHYQITSSPTMNTSLSPLTPTHGHRGTIKAGGALLAMRHTATSRAN